MLSLLNPRMWLYLSIAAFFGYTHMLAYQSGGNAVQVAWDKAAATQATQDRDTERENARNASLRQTNVIEAVNAQTKRTQSLAASAAAARTESDGLRDDLAAVRAALPSATPDASRDAAATSGELLNQCARAYQELASKADSHASDTLTLQSAWPK